MNKLFLKGPDGRVIRAPRAFTFSKVVDGSAVAFVNANKKGT